MPYVPQTTYAKAEPEARTIWNQQILDHGRMTNMKRTLAHSSNALRAYMEWYPLKDEVAAFTGERAALLFAHAISVQSDCLICSTFFRRIFKQWGEDPDQLVLNEQEDLLVQFGRAMVNDPHHVPHAIMNALKIQYSLKQLVSLTAFGGIMIATNLFNDVLQVELDEYLFESRSDK